MRDHFQLSWLYIALAPKPQLLLLSGETNAGLNALSAKGHRDVGATLE
jgi:hypothetical protein